MVRKTETEKRQRGTPLTRRTFICTSLYRGKKPNEPAAASDPFKLHNTILFIFITLLKQSEKQTQPEAACLMQLLSGGVCFHFYFKSELSS